MADQEKDKQLDAFLDSLLARYSDVEPRPGLETRILAAVAHAGTQSPSLWRNARWISLGAAAAALVGLIIALAMLLPSHTRQDQGSPVVNSNAPSQPLIPPPARRIEPEQQDVAKVPAGHHIRTMHDTASTGTELRRDVFPTPAPLSDQEKLALRYLARTPRAELVAQSHPDPVPDEDLLQNQQGVFNPLTNNRSSANSN